MREDTAPTQQSDLLFEDYDGKPQRLVYVSYVAGKPHDALGEDINCPGSVSTWDIEEDPKMEEKGYYMYYESGGFSLNSYPHEPSSDYWAAEGVPLKNPEKGNRLAEPLPGTLEAFTEGRAVLDLQYCRVCDAFYDEDWCPDHHREKKGGGAGYRKGFRKRDLPAAGVPPIEKEEASHAG